VLGLGDVASVPGHRADLLECTQVVHLEFLQVALHDEQELESWEEEHVFDFVFVSAVVLLG